MNRYKERLSHEKEETLKNFFGICVHGLRFIRHQVKVDRFVTNRPEASEIDTNAIHRYSALEQSCFKVKDALVCDPAEWYV